MSASARYKQASAALDGDSTTRWHTPGDQRPGQWLAVDLGQAQRIHGVSLDTGPWPKDYPRGLRVEVSRDSRAWTLVHERTTELPPITHLLDPHRAVRVVFEPIDARYLRLTCIGAHDRYYWTVAELGVHSPRSKQQP